MDPQSAKLALARAMQDAATEHLPARAQAVHDPMAQFDAVVDDPELLGETRKLFENGHYPQAVEQGYKFLNNLVKRRTGSSADGSGLMTTAFSPGTPLLKMSRLMTRSQQDQQQGYMRIFEGAMLGIRNPLAHEHKHLEDPRAALDLLALCNHLVRTVRATARARRKKSTPKTNSGPEGR